MKAEYVEKQKEYEIKKARAKALKLRMTCTICGEKAKLNCPCGTAQYCTTECQRIDWRDRGHRKACKKIRDDRAAEAARAEAPPSPPKPVVYGPAPRSHADEIRARIAAEHEAARVRREANPEPKPVLSAEKGYVPAMLMVGMAHRGRVERDLDEAARWLERAAAKGNARSPRSMK
ncbi:hypothetical protein JL721_12945 [Aureococcus anophagefferens]|nr:hypothetical protein JL721_12945 [Aureococcus anophagefferens]